MSARALCSKWYCGVFDPSHGELSHGQAFDLDRHRRGAVVRLAHADDQQASLGACSQTCRRRCGCGRGAHRPALPHARRRPPRAQALEVGLSPRAAPAHEQAEGRLRRRVDHGRGRRPRLCRLRPAPLDAKGRKWMERGGGSQRWALGSAPDPIFFLLPVARRSSSPS
jgi:hypothetical protein